MKEFIQKHIALSLGIVLFLGLLIGGLILHEGNKSATTVEDGHTHEKTLYTCSMHPQIREDHPGKCPICGMDLIPIVKSGHSESGHHMDPNAVMMSDEAMALANIETQVVGSGSTNKEIRLFGKIQPDQRLQQTQAAYVEGRIEQLFINAVGDRVSKGQTLAVIYSPSLYTAEQELVAALQDPEANQRKALVQAAIEKLQLLNIAPSQIQQILKTKKASPYMPLKANTSGTVVEKTISQGDYVKQGQPLLKIANLGSVWAVFQAYEGDLPFIHQGEKIRFTSEAMPGKVFTGTVSFIDPILDAKSRTAGVRVVMSNVGGQFKPEMIITGIAVANMKNYNHDIVVPKSAVLWTGKRSVVYVKEDMKGHSGFMLRQVTLGPSLPDSYVILDGLAEGEEIVTNGAFAIDASAQLDGKKSMMNQ
mgnify:CR=1 FL=1